VEVVAKPNANRTKLLNRSKMVNLKLKIELLDSTELRYSQEADSEHASCLDFSHLRKSFRNICGNCCGTIESIERGDQEQEQIELLDLTNQRYSVLEIEHEQGSYKAEN